MRKSLHVFSFIALNSTIASNKYRQKHNILATIQRAKLEGAYERSEGLHFKEPKTQMQTSTWMDKVVIEDYNPSLFLSFWHDDPYRDNTTLIMVIDSREWGQEGRESCSRDIILFL
jgi:hypothetical protein